MKSVPIALAATLAAVSLASAQTYLDSKGTAVPGFTPLVGCSTGGSCAGPASAANPLPTQSVNPSTIYSAQISCSGATSAAQALPSQALINGVVLTAGKADTGVIYLGPSGETASAGYPIGNTQNAASASYGATNLSAIYYLCTVATDVLLVTGN